MDQEVITSLRTAYDRKVGERSNRPMEVWKFRPFYKIFIPCYVPVAFSSWTSMEVSIKKRFGQATN